MKTIIYHSTPDKEKWGKGPWLDEPDKMQWQDKASGLPCLAVRGPMGAWCGYVGVPNGHPCYKVGYDDIDVAVHGGLTFAGHCTGDDEASSICHKPEEGEADDVWWLGFDCNHLGDIAPRLLHRRQKMGFGYPGECYKTLNYVQKQCKALARQLAAKAKVDSQLLKTGTGGL